MRTISVIGIGCGDPRQVTLEAVDAIAATDVFFVVVKEGRDELAVARERLIAAHHPGGARVVELADPPRPWRTAPDYAAAVRAWRAARTERWGSALDASLPGDDARGAFLAWGDPSLYESTLSIVSGLPGVRTRVVPGVSSLHALTARHGIALNRPAGAVQITPARRLAEEGMPAGADDVVVMLDGSGAYTDVDPAGLDVFWGAHLGTEHERLLRGPLDVVAPQMTEARAEIRERVGWLFDIYLLRRR